MLFVSTLVLACLGHIGLTFSKTPLEAGEWMITVRATDSAGESATYAYKVRVANASLRSDLN